MYGGGVSLVATAAFSFGSLVAWRFTQLSSLVWCWCNILFWCFGGYLGGGVCDCVLLVGFGL